MGEVHGSKAAQRLRGRESAGVTNAERTRRSVPGPVPRSGLGSDGEPESARITVSDHRGTRYGIR
eukprot:766618-Hanusia_phi.AAC.2